MSKHTRYTPKTMVFSCMFFFSKTTKQPKNLGGSPLNFQSTLAQAQVNALDRAGRRSCSFPKR